MRAPLTLSNGDRVWVRRSDLEWVRQLDQLREEVARTWPGHHGARGPLFSGGARERFRQAVAAYDAHLVAWRADVDARRQSRHQLREAV